MPCILGPGFATWLMLQSTVISLYGCHLLSLSPLVSFLRTSSTFALGLESKINTSHSEETILVLLSWHVFFSIGCSPGGYMSGCFIITISRHGRTPKNFSV